jgi:uncharacterized protein
MKKLILLFAIIISNYGYSQKIDDGHKHKVVIQFVASDSLSQHTLVGNIKNLKTQWPKSKIEVVFHSGGITMAISSKTKYAKELQDFAENQGVNFVVCQNTMKARNITKDQLLPFMNTVPSGVAEVVLKEEKGWSYLKGGI